MPDDLIDDHARLDVLERSVQNYRISRDGWTLLVLAFGALAALAGIMAVGFAMRDDGETAVAGESLEADLSEFAIDLSASNVTAGGTITVRNNGTMIHNLAVRDTDLASADLSAGETTDLDVSGLEPGTYEVHCTIPGHTESGMKAQLTVGGDVAGAAPPATRRRPTHGDHTLTAAEGALQDQTMIESMVRPSRPRPPASATSRSSRRCCPTAPSASSSTAAIIDWEVAPGETSSRRGPTTAWCPALASTSTSATRCEVEVTNELPDRHRHPLARHRRPQRPGRRVARSPRSSIASGRDLHLRLHRHRSRRSACTTPTSTPTRPSPTGCSARCTSATSPLPAGQTVSGIAIPADVRDRPGAADGAQRRRRHRPQPRRQELPGHRSDRRRRRRLDPGPLLQRGPAGAPDAPARRRPSSWWPRTASRSTTRTPPTPSSWHPASATRCSFNPTVAGTWVWHCHILNHVESADGMFGMVTALVVK